MNEYRSFATDLEREGISNNLQQTEEWLYEDGDDESESVYTEKLEDLKKVLLTSLFDSSSLYLFEINQIDTQQYK